MVLRQPQTTAPANLSIPDCNISAVLRKCSLNLEGQSPAFLFAEIFLDVRKHTDAGWLAIVSRVRDTDVGTANHHLLEIVRLICEPLELVIVLELLCEVRMPSLSTLLTPLLERGRGTGVGARSIWVGVCFFGMYERMQVSRKGIVTLCLDDFEVGGPSVSACFENAET